MEQENNVLEILKKTIKGLGSFLYGMILGFLYILLGAGAISSIILLIKLYPTTFIQIFGNPFVLAYLKILMILFNVVLTLIIWFITAFILIKIFKPYLKYKREENKRRRTIFKKELKEEIKKEMKNARGRRINNSKTSK